MKTLLLLFLFSFEMDCEPPARISFFQKPEIPAITIEDGFYESRPHFIIKTKSIIWYYDKEGGGFSRMIDIEDRDWISFKTEPWGEYPASAASAFRGIPNLVFKSEDGGAGHPGHDKCFSSRRGRKIISESKSGKWKWAWTFFDSYARLEILKSDRQQAYWFLYEGTPTGCYSPYEYFFGTSRNEGSGILPDFYKGNLQTGNYSWMYCGKRNANYLFYMVQLQPDEKTDMLAFLGNTPDGINSPDGMTVFGFGRDEKGNPLLSGNQKFAVGLFPSDSNDTHTRKKLEHFIQTEFSLK